jgi:hypothetical protein
MLSFQPVGKALDENSKLMFVVELSSWVVPVLS